LVQACSISWRSFSGPLRWRTSLIDCNWWEKKSNSKPTFPNI
jgi:hypothetical protein